MACTHTADGVYVCVCERVSQSPAESSAPTLLLLLVAALQALEGLHVLDGLQRRVEVIHDVCDQRFDVLLVTEEQPVSRVRYRFCLINSESAYRFQCG